MQSNEDALVKSYNSGQLRGSFNHLQYFIITMGLITQNQGKKSFFGADKGKKHFDKFVDLFIPQLVLMIEEGLISRHDDPSDICDMLHLMSCVFVKAFPMWQNDFPLVRSLIRESSNDALIFSQSFFQQNKQIASDIVQAQLRKLFPK